MRTAVTIVAAALAVVAVAVLGLALWLRAYAPLSSTGTYRPGPDLGADVEPTFGSGGKTVFLPIYRQGKPFDTAFTVENTGRFAVTLTGIEPDRTGAIYAAKLYATDAANSAAPRHLHAFNELRLAPKDSAFVAVAWRLDCSKTGDSTQASADRVRLRYRYLSLFNRTQEVELPFAVTLRCSGGPPASP